MRPLSTLSGLSALTNSVRSYLLLKTKISKEIDMNDKYEANDNSHTYRIESEHALFCAETDRVVAVFYNEYDLADVLKLLNKKPSLDVESLPTPEEVKLGLLDVHDFTVAQVRCIAAEVYQPLYNLLKHKQGN
jgi:hypothetical protein